MEVYMTEESLETWSPELEEYAYHSDSEVPQHSAGPVDIQEMVPAVLAAIDSLDEECESFTQTHCFTVNCRHLYVQCTAIPWKPLVQSWTKAWSSQPLTSSTAPTASSKAAYAYIRVTNAQVQ